MGDVLKGKVAVVTGSGQGIGRGIALGLAKEGAKIVTNNRKKGSTGFAILKEPMINALSKEQRESVFKQAEETTGDAETTAQTIKELGGEAVPFFGDVSKFEVARELIQAAVDSYGKIDILVNVACTFGFLAIWEMTEELWDHVNNVKPKSYFNCIRHAAPLMMDTIEIALGLDIIDMVPELFQLYPSCRPVNDGTEVGAYTQLYLSSLGGRPPQTC